MKKTNKTTGSNSKKHKKMVLGRGLDSLLPKIESGKDRTKEYFQCDINLIHPNRFQPRVHFSKDDLEDLRCSIKEHGVIQPLLLRKDVVGYELIAGERRLRAARMAGLNQVPVVIKDVSNANLLEMSIIENIQREDLNPLEEADAYQLLMSEFDLTQDKVAERVGKSRSSVANFLRLQKLPEQIKAGIMDKTLSMGHARAILGAETSAQQMAAWRAVVSKGLSVRETEAFVKSLKVKKQNPKKSAMSSDETYLSGLAEDISLRLGTKVRIKKHGQKGRVEIEFYSNDDLDRLLDLFKQ
ncbi:MAG: ParB/RepB/Spo0J family partition protein [Deltaproteobacteria bacterium]|nr:ParB/RepB/Spo0J family partition protein [Deltaproteobacteria bacterium]MBW2661140.1 ParB/RepB/Spo0J family partition protein [Deltaproteobacteria bacterium]